MANTELEPGTLAFNGVQYSRG